MPGSKLVENIGTEVTFQLPEEGARSGAFEQLFNDLDRNLQRLGISSYGISDTTLEEVSIKPSTPDVLKVFSCACSMSRAT